GFHRPIASAAENQRRGVPYRDIHPADANDRPRETPIEPTLTLPYRHSALLRPDPGPTPIAHVRRQIDWRSNGRPAIAPCPTSLVLLLRQPPFSRCPPALQSS